MSDFMTAYKQRSWASDLETYKRYSAMAGRSTCPHVQGIANKGRHYMRERWPTHIKVFNDIDTECKAPYNYSPHKETETHDNP